jgi:hypothetical protein
MMGECQNEAGERVETRGIILAIFKIQLNMIRLQLEHASLMIKRGREGKHVSVR